MLITHHHYDHIGELHDVILSSWLMGRTRPLRLFGPPETRRIVDTLHPSGLRQGHRVPCPRSRQRAVAASARPPTSSPARCARAPTGAITAEIVDHGNRLDFPDAFRQRWVCLGYRFECPQGVIAFSGDTVDCPGLRRLAANADILVQCCYLARSEIDCAADAASGRLHAGLRRHRGTHRSRGESWHAGLDPPSPEAGRGVGRDAAGRARKISPGTVLLGQDGLRVTL